ncbi:hypothetical protein AAY473_034224 [Plecturocebus cupreus]
MPGLFIFLMYSYSLKEDSCTHLSWLILCVNLAEPQYQIFVETGFHHISQAGFELMTSSDLLTSASQSANLQGVQDQPDQHGETPSLLKIQKISWVWWCMPVIPATLEAEAGESLESRGQSLSLDNKSETPSRKKKKKKECVFSTDTREGNITDRGMSGGGARGGIALGEIPNVDDGLMGAANHHGTESSELLELQQNKEPNRQPRATRTWRVKVRGETVRTLGHWGSCAGQKGSAVKQLQLGAGQRPGPAPVRHGGRDGGRTAVSGSPGCPGARQRREEERRGK